MWGGPSAGFSRSPPLGAQCRPGWLHYSNSPPRSSTWGGGLHEASCTGCTSPGGRSEGRGLTVPGAPGTGRGPPIFPRGVGGRGNRDPRFLQAGRADSHSKQIQHPLPQLPTKIHRGKGGVSQHPTPFICSPSGRIRREAPPPGRTVTSGWGPARRTRLPRASACRPPGPARTEKPRPESLRTEEDPGRSARPSPSSLRRLPGRKPEGQGGRWGWGALQGGCGGGSRSLTSLGKHLQETQQHESDQEEANRVLHGGERGPWRGREAGESRKWTLTPPALCREGGRLSQTPPPLSDGPEAPLKASSCPGGLRPGAF